MDAVKKSDNEMKQFTESNPSDLVVITKEMYDKLMPYYGAEIPFVKLSDLIEDKKDDRREPN